MKYTNRELFTPVLRPLVKPEYVLRMAAAKSEHQPWGWKAQRKHLTKMREALTSALAACDIALSLLPEEPE